MSEIDKNLLIIRNSLNLDIDRLADRVPHVQWQIYRELAEMLNRVIQRHDAAAYMIRNVPSKAMQDALVTYVTEFMPHDQAVQVLPSLRRITSQWEKDLAPDETDKAVEEGSGKKWYWRHNS